MRGSFCVHAGGVFRRTAPAPDGVIFHCPGHSIRTDAGDDLAPLFGTFIVTRDELVYQLREERHAWPLVDVEGFTATPAPGTTTARLGGGPILLVSVRHPDSLPKLQQAVRIAQLAATV